MQPTISPERWLEHLEAWQQTDLTQADYCRMHGLRTNQFWYWKSKLQGHGAVIEQKITSGFAIAQFETVTAPQQALSITLPDGTRLMIFALQILMLLLSYWRRFDNATNTQTC